MTKPLAIEKEKMLLHSREKAQLNEKYKSLVAPERLEDIYLQVLSGGK
ncbi:hypothetical protein GLW20_00680 [Virgibacillus halodenitrificans]|nr:hypothetical protein [Virgibacillus halodenitrificans]